MFSLQATKLNPSWLGVTLWVVAISCCFLLIPWYFWSLGQQLLLLLAFVLLQFILFLLTFRRSAKQVGIDLDGAFLMQNNQREALLFVRINSLQLIAKKVSEESYGAKPSFWGQLWPVFVVIYRDQLSSEDYDALRSYAAQQMLSRGEGRS